MRHRGAVSGWRWQKKWLKLTEDGFGSKAKPRRERLYGSSYALRNQGKRREGWLQNLHLWNHLLCILPCRMRGMVVSSAIFATLLRGGGGRGQIPPCVGEKTGGALPEMCRAQFLRSCVLHACPVGTVRKSRYRHEVLRESDRRRTQEPAGLFQQTLGRAARTPRRSCSAILVPIGHISPSRFGKPGHLGPGF